MSIIGKVLCNECGTRIMLHEENCPKVLRRRERLAEDMKDSNIHPAEPGREMPALPLMPYTRDDELRRVITVDDTPEKEFAADTSVKCNRGSEHLRCVHPINHLGPCQSIREKSLERWFAAIDEAFVVNHLDALRVGDNARVRLAELIAYEQKIALDPLVSEEAKKLSADTARLEFILRRYAQLVRKTNGGVVLHQIGVPDDVPIIEELSGWHTDYRAAIDEAMAKEAK